MNPVSGVERRPFAFGGAVRVFWINPTDATFDHVKVLRKTTGTFSGPSDPAATLIYTGRGLRTPSYQPVFRADPATAEVRVRSLVDAQGVLWATTYYYALYALNAAETDVSAAVIVSTTTPEISAFEEVDLIAVLMDYVRAYFQRQIQTGALVLRPGITELPVLDGPPLIDTVALPCLSIHLDADAPEAFALGDALTDGDASGDARVYRRGYLGTLTLAVTGWTENPDTRRALYRQLKACLISVRPLLADLGAINPTIAGHYAEDFEQYNLPMYLAALTLTATVETSVRAVPVAPSVVTVEVREPIVL